MKEFKNLENLEKEIGWENLIEEILSYLKRREIRLYGIKLDKDNILKIRRKLEEYNIDLSEF